MSTYTKDQEDEDLEAEALILHRVSTDRSGRPHLTSFNNDPESNRGPLQDLEDDVEDFNPRLAKLPPRGVLEDSNRSTNLEKTGRPRWFRSLLDGDVPLNWQGLKSLFTNRDLPRPMGVPATANSKIRRRRANLVRISGAILGLVLTISVFYFALGPRLGLDASSKTYQYGEDFWTDQEGAFPFEFNESPGYPGVFKQGSPALFAEEQKWKGKSERPSPTIGSSPIQTFIPGYDPNRPSPFDDMGPLTPYRPSDSFGVDDQKYSGTPAATPEGRGFCSLEQVHILHRHGSRYPTTGAPTEKLFKFLEENRGKVEFRGQLAFLNGYRNRLGTELLTPVGRAQLFDSGAKASLLYGELVAKDLEEKKKLLARAGSQKRIVDSGLAWLNGFFGDDWKNTTNFEIQIEAPKFNTTTAPEFACPNSWKGSYMKGDEESKRYAEVYLKDAVERLQKDVTGTGGVLDAGIVLAMQQLCPYETVALGHSPFCQLFDAEEWKGHSHYWDVKFLRSYGPESRLGKALGLGWTNELLARLRSQAWKSEWQTSENSTLDQDERTFPLGRRFYVDFSHDSTLLAVLSSLGVQARFKVSQLVPFAARFSFEVFSCSDQRLIRLKINEAVLPLHLIQGCAKASRQDGLCPLEDFTRALEERNRLDWWRLCTLEE
ncbi:phosphoglycerate mutase-like protein [Violaceomyces palustris]|uniref:Phosphoglycerate mutase-like protein n=1 Tax=Violaceomyces palustris TaxID=1673888 RepID=A0ACD0NXG2_9BASI|nr:phosphoglycerate mutase-like protein [Violaceomyces palustris]